MADEKTYIWLKENAKITVSEDKMEASIRFNHPLSECKLEVNDIIDFLNKENITYGINTDTILELINQEVAFKNIVIAQGTPCENGSDGHYEYHFQTVIDKKPCLLEDGSVDYSVYDRIETVKKGQEIVHYIKRTMGKDGTDVYGKMIKSKDGKELVPLKGKGFSCSEDKSVYISEMDGKVEIVSGKLIVTNLLEIKENVNYINNKVSFGGDIVIHGDVMSGTTIEATGEVRIRGHVENALIIAGKDVIIEKGMQGGGEGSIVSGGSVSGKFFEQVIIKAQGSVSANALLHCNIETKGEVTITGKKGIIIGGVTKALVGVTAATIGNTLETKTIIIVGVKENLNKKVNSLEKQIDELQQRLCQIEAALTMISEREEIGNEQRFHKEKIKLVQTKIVIQSEIAELEKKKEELLTMLKRSNNSRIRVEKNMEPGVELSINEMNMHIKEQQYGVTFVSNGGEIEIRMN